MDFISTWIEATFEINSNYQNKIVSSIIIIISILLLQKLISKFFIVNIKDVQLRYKVKKTLGYIIIFIGILLLVRQWFNGFKEFTTFLGIFSAGLAIALKDLILNIVGWIFIVVRKPLEVGDRVQIEDTAGDVIDLRIFQFTLLEIGNLVEGEQSTGRIVHIPNGKIFNYTLANYSKGFKYIWNEVNVTITFESEWKEAKEILLEIATKHSIHFSQEAEKRVKEASRKYMIFYSNLTPIVYTKVIDTGVMLTIRHLCKPRNRRIVTQNIWEEILDRFSENDNIDFAYNTIRFYDDLKESKSSKMQKEEV